MSAYIKLSTLEYPRHEGDIRLEYPEITETQTGNSFPCPNTYVLVKETTAPEFNFATQVCYETPPVQIDSVWTQQWAVKNMTDEELQKIANFIAKENGQ